MYVYITIHSKYNCSHFPSSTLPTPFGIRMDQCEDEQNIIRLRVRDV